MLSEIFLFPNRIIPSYIKDIGIIIPDLNHKIESILLKPKKPIIQTLALIKLKIQLIRNIRSGTEKKEKYRINNSFRAICILFILNEKKLKPNVKREISIREIGL